MNIFKRIFGRDETDVDRIIEDEYIMGREMIHTAKMLKAMLSPTDKRHEIFHGGCNDCETPLEKGIGTCQFCQYFCANWRLPNLNNKYKIERERKESVLKKVKELGISDEDIESIRK